MNDVCQRPPKYLQGAPQPARLAFLAESESRKVLCQRLQFCWREVGNRLATGQTAQLVFLRKPDLELAIYKNKKRHTPH